MAVDKYFQNIFTAPYYQIIIISIASVFEKSMAIIKYFQNIFIAPYYQFLIINIFHFVTRRLFLSQITTDPSTGRIEICHKAKTIRQIHRRRDS